MQAIVKLRPFLLLAAADLASCMGSVPATTTAGYALASVPVSGGVHAIGSTVQRPGSAWMTPQKTREPLLYVSDYGANTIDVYSYPQGVRVGTLTGFSGPDGICLGKHGEIWIANNLGGSVVGLAHGAKKVNVMLSDPNEHPVGCSVDPTTGNLAVSNIFTTGAGQGSVAIYANAHGAPKLFKDSSMFHVYFVGYDNQGNLYLDGRNKQGAFVFAELAKGHKTISNITLSGGTIYFPGNVRWDGQYVAVGDQEYQGQETSAIYQTTGSGGTIVGVTPLSGSKDVAGYAIDHTIAIAPDTDLNELFFYPYPTGGSPTKRISRFDGPHGAVVSR